MNSETDSINGPYLSTITSSSEEFLQQIKNLSRSGRVQLAKQFRARALAAMEKHGYKSHVFTARPISRTAFLS